MTLNELSQLYWLKKEIQRDRERLEDLRIKARSPSGPNLFGMKVQGGRQESRLEELEIRISELEEIIGEKQERCMEEQIKIERYISSIPDSRIRLIFTYRFIDCLTWIQTAMKLGGNNSVTGVQSVCYRYLKGENQH